MKQDTCTDLAELAIMRTEALHRWHAELEKLAKQMNNGNRGRQLSACDLQNEAVIAARYTFDTINLSYAVAQKKTPRKPVRSSAGTVEMAAK